MSTHSAEKDATLCGPCRRGQHGCCDQGPLLPCRCRACVIPPEKDATTSTEWAVQCYTSAGHLFTGHPFPTRKQAEESGERLARINGAEWWIVSRRVTRYAAVLTDWTRVIPPGVERDA